MKTKLHGKKKPYSETISTHCDSQHAVMQQQQQHVSRLENSDKQWELLLYD